MIENDRDFHRLRAQALARLATLQRLREQAQDGNRAGMLRAIEQLVEHEVEALRAAEQMDLQPRFFSLQQYAVELSPPSQEKSPLYSGSAP